MNANLFHTLFQNDTRLGWRIKGLKVKAYQQKTFVSGNFYDHDTNICIFIIFTIFVSAYVLGSNFFNQYLIDRLLAEIKSICPTLRG